MRSCLRLCLPGLALLFVATGAMAEPPGGPALNWVRMPGAEHCIGSVELASAVEERLGRPVFVRSPDALVLIEGRVSPRPQSGFVAVIQVSDAGGQVYGSREIGVDDSDCARLGEVAALVIAVTIRRDGSPAGLALPSDVAAQLDALFDGEPSELDPTRTPSAPTAKSTGPRAEAGDTDAQAPAAAGETRRDAGQGEGTPESRPARRADPEPARAPWQLKLDVGAWMESGLQPGGTLGGVARAQLEVDGVLGVGVGATLALAREQDVQDERGALSFQPRALSSWLCLAERRVLGSALSLCAWAQLGWVRVEADGFRVDNDDAERPWVALGPMASIYAPMVGPLYVRLGARLTVRIVRPGFEYRRSDGVQTEAFAMDAVGLAAELALGARL
jgi:hypothetical protein